MKSFGYVLINIVKHRITVGMEKLLTLEIDSVPNNCRYTAYNPDSASYHQQHLVDQRHRE